MRYRVEYDRSPRGLSLTSLPPPPQQQKNKKMMSPTPGQEPAVDCYNFKISRSIREIPDQFPSIGG